MALNNAIRRAALLCIALFPSLSGYTAYDVMELPAVPSDIASKSLIYSISKFHGRYWATGIRGHILYSDDGQNWTQVPVPVRSGITDIYFATPEKGWAVGHEGTILHSSDGGKSWVKQYDGLRYGTEGLALYQNKLEAEPDDEILQLLVEEMQFAIEQGADKPFFKVAFHSEQFGHALGAYGMVVETTDGGETWVPVLERVDNYNFYHLFDYAVLPQAGEFFICGEVGTVLKSDLNTEEKETIALESPWEGSFFTCTTTAENSIVMGGLRGNIYRSADIGQSWQLADKPPTSTIIDSILLSDGRLVVVCQAGEILLSDDDGLSFVKVPVSGIERIHAVVEADDGSLLLAGPKGIKSVSLSGQ